MAITKTEVVSRLVSFMGRRSIMSIGAINAKPPKSDIFRRGINAKSFRPGFCCSLLAYISCNISSPPASPASPASPIPGNFRSNIFLWDSVVALRWAIASSELRCLPLRIHPAQQLFLGMYGHTQSRHSNQGTQQRPGRLGAVTFDSKIARSSWMRCL
jgi:hypothetical protein